MPPRENSRDTFAEEIVDADGDTVLTVPNPYRYREFPDTIRHPVVDGDTLQGLAGRYYAALPRACALWWVLADFQPDPIHDPTIALEAGRILLIPSPRVVSEEILTEARRAEATG